MFLQHSSSITLILKNNIHPCEVLSRYRDSQLQMDEKYIIIQMK